MVLVAALLAAGAYAGSPSPAAKGSGAQMTACAEAAEPAEELAPKSVRRAVRCLVNEQRVARGAAKLAGDESLQLAAQRHTKTMVAANCLDHRCGDEPNLETRLAKAGYFTNALAWGYAENTGCAPTAEAMVRSWMASRQHRAYLLDRDFRELGVGAIPMPVASLCEDGYTTFAVVVGWREITR